MIAIQECCPALPEEQPYTAVVSRHDIPSPDGIKATSDVDAAKYCLSKPINKNAVKAAHLS